MAEYAVEFHIRPSGSRCKVTQKLSLREVHHYLSLDERARELWIDANLDYWIEEALIGSESLYWEVTDQVKMIGLPETAAELPPLVHPNQQVLL